METNKLLSKIQSASEVKKREEKFEKTKQEICKMEAIVKLLIPRMKDMYLLVDALAKEDIHNSWFTSNSIHHGIGFFTNDQNIVFGAYKNSGVCRPLRKFGCKGGGCCGKDLIVDLDSQTIRYEGEQYSYYHKYYLEEIIKKIDEFENRLEEYIENL